jgi:dephospho-CoA kinase
MELTRDNMHKIADELRDSFGAGYLAESLLDLAKTEGGNAVIESIRTIGEVQALKQKASDFYLFAVDADPKIRYERVHKRNSSTDNITFEKFQEDEASESFHTELWRMNLPACIAQADFVLMNNGTVEEFHRQVEEVMKKV